MRSAARWRNTSAHHRSSGLGSGQQRRVQKTNTKKTRAKVGSRSPTHPLQCEAASINRHQQVALQAGTYEIRNDDATKCQQGPEQWREKRAGHHHFPGVFFFSAALSAGCCLSLANVACLQCSVHAAGHRSGLSSICEAWEDSLQG